MIGEATLVPPKTNQPLDPLLGVESYTATPVLGSATAETSALALPLQLVAVVYHAGLGLMVEQPLPAPDQALVVKPVVPPTAMTCG